MYILLKLIAATLPAILLWIYIWKKDPQQEPTSWLVKSVLAGLIIVFPVSIVEAAIQSVLFGAEGQPSSLVGSTVMAFFVAAIPEESIKLLALWYVLRKNPFFDEHFDGIVYAVCVGLGFAVIENIFYVFGDDEWLGVAISRALLAVPGHYAFALLMGYYYSIYHFIDHSPKMAIRILLVPVVAHGIYDALALSGYVNPYIGGACFFVLIWFCIKMHKLARTKMIALIEKDQQQKDFESA